MLIFEKSQQGRTAITLDKLDVPAYTLKAEKREQEARLPEVSEIDVVRHYTALSKKAHGVDDGFYPLGSCTMKYNPRINEKISGFDGFTKIHPLQDKSTVKGCTELMDTLTDRLCEITGMDAMTLFNLRQARTVSLRVLCLSRLITQAARTPREPRLSFPTAHTVPTPQAHICAVSIS